MLPSADASEAPLAVTVIVVSYNTRDLTLECLRSISRETTGLAFEVLVVDNNSSDGSAAAIRASFPDFELFALEENLGFGGANNFAARHARAPLLLLLNPDTVVLERAIERIVEYAQAHPERGIVGGRTVFADGALNPTSCWAAPSVWSLVCHATCLNVLFPRSAVFDPESMGGWRRDSERDVDIVAGCFLLIARELWDALGGFDERYFMYAEDFDLCMRARRLGHRPRITPSATVVHHGGASEPVKEDKQVRLLTAQAQLLRSHWSPRRAAVGVRLLILGVWVRALGARLLRLLRPTGRFRGAHAWTSVWRRRREWSGAAPDGSG